MPAETLDYLSAIQTNGFCVVPPVIDAQMCFALCDALATADQHESVRERNGSTYAVRNILRDVPAIASLAQSPALRNLIDPILGAAAIPVRGILFDKTPGANWKVAWHQDLSIAVRDRKEVYGFSPWSVKAGVPHVQPPAKVLQNMLTIRLHLDECDESNGPLMVIGGSHGAGVIPSADIPQWRGKYPTTICTVAQGGAMLMRPLLLHASGPATSPKHRRVVHIEYAAGALPGGLQWFIA